MVLGTMNCMLKSVLCMLRGITKLDEPTYLFIGQGVHRGICPSLTDQKVMIHYGNQVACYLHV